MVKRMGFFAFLTYSFIMTLLMENCLAQKKDPLWLVYFIGMKDGAIGTDGVIFKVEIGEVGKKRVVIAEKEWSEHEWLFGKVNISKYKGKKVTIRFITDPGPTTDYDWACWAEMKIIEGRLPKGYSGEGIPAGTKLMFDFTKTKPTQIGYIKDEKDVTPIDTKTTGATFLPVKINCGGVQKQGYLAQPGWKGDAAGCPAFGEFEVDLSRPCKVIIFDRGIVRGQVVKPGVSAPKEPVYSLTFGIRYPEYCIILPLFYHWQAICLSYILPDYGIPFDRLVYFLQVRETGKMYRSDDPSACSIISLGDGRYSLTFKNVEISPTGWKTNVGPFTIQYAR